MPVWTPCPRGSGPTIWVTRLHNFVSALNNEVTQLTGKKPAKAIKEKTGSLRPVTPYLCLVRKKEKKSPTGELEGGWRRATDAISSLKVYVHLIICTFNLHNISNKCIIIYHYVLPPFVKPNELIVYCVQDGELIAIPPKTTLPPVSDTQ